MPTAPFLRLHLNSAQHSSQFWPSFTAWLSCTSIDVDCGFIQYAPGATVDLSFTARHPHNFATFNFTIYRGSSNPVPVADASGSVGASPINGFIRNASSVFTKSGIPVPALTAPCTKAAFAENLYVWALATDGWYRLYYLDASAIPKAFALEPSP